MRCATAALAFALALVAGPLCAAEYRAAAYVFGTIAEITVSDVDANRAPAAVERVLAEFDRIHRDLHTWQPGALSSLNEAIARGDKNIRTTAEIASLIRSARELSDRSGGLFNPAIGALVRLWGFQRDRPGGPVPDPGAVARIVRAAPRMDDLEVRGETVTSANPAVQLDFGGYAKGYALDRAAALLHEAGIRNALVDIGGNLMALGRHGERPWRIAIEAPRGNAVLATLDLRDGEAIGTSGDYRRYYEIAGRRYTHVIDPRSGWPVAGVEAATVLVGPRPGAGALSDAATKPIFIAGPSGWREAAAQLGISRAMLIDSSGTVHLTRALAERLRFEDSHATRQIVP